MSINLKKLNGEDWGLIFALVFIVSVGIYAFKEVTSLNKYGHCTIGTIDYLGGTSSGYLAFYTYRINNKWYEGNSLVSGKSKHLVVRDMKFVVKYEKDNPTNSKIFLSVPIADQMNSDIYEISKDCCDTLITSFWGN